MGNLSTSLLLLLVALVLLWLAVTDQLGRVLDAYDVLTGKRTSGGTLAATGSTVTSFTTSTLTLPSLPAIGDAHHVNL